MAPHTAPPSAAYWAAKNLLLGKRGAACEPGESEWSLLFRMSESAAKIKPFFCLFSFHGCATLFLRMHYKRTERRIRLCWEAT
jgi:hypothetical protein